MPSKVPYINDRLNDQRQLFIGLTETWLNEHRDSELRIEGYQLFRGDRIRAKGKYGRFSGGVALYVRDDLASTCEVTCTFSNGVVDIVTIYSKKENILITVLYRQPDDRVNGHRSQITEFREGLSELMKSIPVTDGTVPDIIFGGDFNLSHIN